MSALAHALLNLETQSGHVGVQRSLALLGDIALPLRFHRKILEHLQKKYASFTVSQARDKKTYITIDYIYPIR